MKIKKGDKVKILSGKDKGKVGRVEKVIPKKELAVVEGLNISKKMLKPSKKSPKGGQVQFPAPIHVSNLCYFCSTCEKATKTKVKVVGDKKIRVCSVCQKENMTKDIKEKPKTKKP